jgi:hypothetical protein
MASLYGNGGELRPQDLARCMMDTYRAMNKHYIPTGYELSSFAKYPADHPESSIAVAEELSLLRTSAIPQRVSSSSTLPPKTLPCADLLHFAFPIFLKPIENEKVK